MLSKRHSSFWVLSITQLKIFLIDHKIIAELLFTLRHLQIICAQLLIWPKSLFRWLGSAFGVSPLQNKAYSYYEWKAFANVFCNVWRMLLWINNLLLLTYSFEIGKQHHLLKAWFSTFRARWTPSFRLGGEIVMDKTCFRGIFGKPTGKLCIWKSTWKSWFYIIKDFDWMGF